MNHTPPNEPFPPPRRSTSAAASFDAEQARINNLSIADRMREALALHRQLSHITPAPAPRTKSTHVRRP